MNLDDVFDLAGYLRYGMPTSEKEALALRGDLPGAPPAASADAEEAQRYAAGYLFGKAHPTIAPVVQPFVDALKNTGIPGMGKVPFITEGRPELQDYAGRGLARALQDILEGRK